jgi:hypothetical protein
MQEKKARELEALADLKGSAQKRRAAQDFFTN